MFFFSTFLFFITFVLCFQVNLFVCSNKCKNLFIFFKENKLQIIEKYFKTRKKKKRKERDERNETNRKKNKAYQNRYFLSCRNYTMRLRGKKKFLGVSLLFIFYFSKQLKISFIFNFSSARDCFVIDQIENEFDFKAIAI